MKDFLKQYTVWILLGVCIALLLVLIVLSVYRNTKEQKTEIEKIQNPYFVQTENIKIDLKDNRVDIPEKEKVYKVLGNNDELLKSLLQNFYKDDSVTNFSEEIYLMFNKDTFSYSPKTKILMINSQEGLTLRLDISSQEDIGTFFSEYFNIDSVKVTNVTSLGNEIEYKGKFILKKIELGTVHLDGESFVARVNDSGNITNLSVLLIKRDDIKESQSFLIADILYLVSNGKYPKMVKHIELEERFYESSPFVSSLAVLKEFYTEALSKIYIFSDSENGYILPTYKLEGDGRLINPIGDKYWAKTNIYICAIHPLFLYERELPEGEEFSLPVSPDGL